jgi:hypothetical protein
MTTPNIFSSSLHFVMVISVILTASFDISNAEDEQSVTGFDFTYVDSYDRFDFCGDNDAGKWYREAAVALIEACQLPLKDKAEFYKRALLASDAALSTIVKLSLNQSFPSSHALSHPTTSCTEYLAVKDSKELRERLHKYHMKKAELTDVFLNTSTGKSFDSISTLCKQATKNISVF